MSPAASRGLFLFALATVCPAPARADWAWSAPAECADAATARAAVSDTLGYEIDPALLVQARIEGSAGSWRASIEVRGAGVVRVRELTTDDATCGALDSAAIVVTALLIDEVRAQEPVALAIAPDPIPTTAASEPSWVATIRLGALARIDELPGLAGAPTLDVEVLAPGAVPILLSLGFWPPVESLREGRGGRFTGGLATLGVCPAARVGWFELGGCGGVSATYLLADGLGVAEAQHTDGLVFSVLGSFFARVQLVGPLWLRASLGVLVPLVRPRATLREDGVEVLVHEVAPVVPEGSLGVELRFGDR